MTDVTLVRLWFRSQRLPQPGVVQQDVLHPALYDFGIERLRAHGRVGIQGVHDRVHQFRVEVRRVGELFLGVVRRLLAELLRFEELPLNNVIHVHQLVLIRQLALEQVIHLLDDLV